MSDVAKNVGVVHVGWRSRRDDSEAKAAWELAIQKGATDFDRQMATGRWREIIALRQKGMVTDTAAMDACIESIDKLAASMGFAVSLEDAGGTGGYDHDNPKAFTWSRRIELRYAGNDDAMNVGRWNLLLDKVRATAGSGSYESNWEKSIEESDRIEAIREATDPVDEEDDEDRDRVPREMTVTEQRLLAARKSVEWSVNTQVWDGPAGRS